MRQLSITSQTTSIQQLPNIGLLTSVVELPHYEMLYVYRNIQEKNEVELRRQHNHIFDKNAVEVYFNGFKIGYISPKVNAIVARQIDKGNSVIARVKSVKKQKAMPLSGLDIEVMIM